MPHSGWFRASDLGEAWADYEDLARVCETAGLTERQAQVVLLYTRGCSYVEIRDALRVPWKEVWRSFRRANWRFLQAFPQLREWLAAANAGRDRHEGSGNALAEAFRGPRRSTGRSPTYGAPDDYHRVLPGILHPQLAPLPRVSDAEGQWVIALDLLPDLIAELAASRARVGDSHVHTHQP